MRGYTTLTDSYHAYFKGGNNEGMFLLSYWFYQTHWADWRMQQALVLNEKEMAIFSLNADSGAFYAIAHEVYVVY